MQKVLLDFFLSNIEIIGLTTVASAALEFWLQQKFVRDLAKDIDRKYTNYRGKNSNQSDVLFCKKAKSICLSIRSNVVSSSDGGTSNAVENRFLVSKIDKLIDDLERNPRGMLWKVNRRTRKKLGRLDREIIDSLNNAFSYSKILSKNEELQENLSITGEALTKRALLVNSTGVVR